jgi:recombination associated protein RdgC
MWFKNLQVYRFPAPWDITPAQLDQQLARHAFRSASSYEMQTHGWASPRDNDSLVHAVNGQLLITLGAEKKLLPASVIKEVTKAKAAELEERQGFKPGRKQVRELKDQVTDELLPRAFNVRRNTWVWIDPAAGWLAIDSGSPGKADEVLALLNKSVEGVHFERLEAALSPMVAMTAWLAADEVPPGFSIDQDTELQSPVEEKATVRFVRHTLDAKEVQRHITAGKQCTRLALTWENRVSFVLTESLTLKRIAPVDVIKESADGVVLVEEERFDADFMLMTGELQQMIADLVDALGGVVEGEKK